MMDAIYISAVGLQAQKEQLDAVAGNFANANTTAYKRQSVDFSAVLDRMSPSPADLPVNGAGPAGPRAVRLDLAQGELRPTGRALDVAITGAGFIEVSLGQGMVGYSRGGALTINDEGVLALADGPALHADIRVPRGATSVQIGTDGSVTAMLEGERLPAVLGQIELATFANPESLIYRGQGVFSAREGAPDPMRSRPGEDGAGRLAVGSLEGSNVRMVDEMVSLMLMQRVYELNSRVVQAADELMGMTNNLRRG